ncbi:uncharacterized protein DUF4974 [Dyadobacter jejuensis]|uniref:Uncharacterized protein DUF4974 n=1 Tax=Dyadobacter jejuensis TaxID=1082580 RepID=A0A316AJU7_9BACT|nr:FecR family protein [Dyadobacter jejuensis]PWJ57936.1 uncharacterized protein DUF4974 [Dyadobacter jejuensis]
MKENKKKGFLEVLQNYINNSLSGSDKKAMDIWYDSLGNPEEESLQASQKQQLEQKLWNKIEQAKSSESLSESVIPFWHQSFFKIATAASVLLVLGFLYLISDYRKVHNFPVKGVAQEEIISLNKVTNTHHTPKKINLEDGSLVELEEGASLYYPKSFDASTRMVYLEGDGFFDISKDPQRPFIVYSGDIVTKVLGTSFTIKKDKNSGKMEVAVITGKVIVEPSDRTSRDFKAQAGGVVLTPNERVTILPDRAEYIAGLVEKPALLDQNEPSLRSVDAFVFAEATLSDIVAKLENAYGVEIKVENAAILNCTITADLTTESLFTKLDILNALLNSDSKIKGKTIVISGGECKPFQPKK